MTNKSNIKMVDGDYEKDEFDDDEDSSSDIDLDDIGEDTSEDDDEIDLQNPPVKTVASIMNKLLSAEEDGPSIILSKIKKRTSSDEEEDEEDDNIAYKEYKRRKLEKQKEKRELMEMGKINPKTDTDREKEKTLRVIATQGVVQLFSAINKHKVELNNELGGAKSFHQKDKIYARKGMENFMGLLKKEGNKIAKQSKLLSVKKEEVEPIELAVKEPKTKTRWNALAQNFYKEPTLNDWDKNDSDAS